MADFRKAPIKYLHDPAHIKGISKEMLEIVSAPGVYSIFDTKDYKVRVPVSGDGDMGGGMNKGRQVRIVALWGGADDGSPLAVTVKSSKRAPPADAIPADFLHVAPVSSDPVEANLWLYALWIDAAPQDGETFTLEARTAHDIAAAGPTPAIPGHTATPGHKATHGQPAKPGHAAEPAGTAFAKPLTVEILPMNPPGGNLPVFAGGDRGATSAAVIAECKRQGVTLDLHIAYALATVEHETGGSFRATRERQFGAHPAAESEASRRKHLRYDQDGAHRSSFVYFGRGYVQLTHDYNYRKIGDLISLDLVADPDLALRPNIALFTLVTGMRTGLFTGASLAGRIKEKSKLSDHDQFVHARGIINGDGNINGERIAKLADAWLATLRPAPAPKLVGRPPPNPPGRPAVAPPARGGAVLQPHR